MKYNFTTKYQTYFPQMFPIMQLNILYVDTKDVNSGQLLPKQWWPGSGPLSTLCSMAGTAPPRN